MTGDRGRDCALKEKKYLIKNLAVHVAKRSLRKAMTYFNRKQSKWRPYLRRRMSLWFAGQIATLAHQNVYLQCVYVNRFLLWNWCSLLSQEFVQPNDVCEVVPERGCSCGQPTSFVYNNTVFISPIQNMHIVICEVLDVIDHNKSLLRTQQVSDKELRQRRSNVHLFSLLPMTTTGNNLVQWINILRFYGHLEVRFSLIQHT